ncbi:MAG: NADH-quinone oxidoreductase subunit C [Candidatus Hatepunaea meridiana]|nr:NADH-quinone oxidoreductase subunit C [Candidatus Hatepunaea meridiana]
MTSEELINHIIERFPEAGLECLVDKGQAAANVPVEQLEEFLKVMKDTPEFGFDLFMDITAVDWLERKPRFDVVYHLYSTEHNHRLRIKVGVKEDQQVPSSALLWMVANPMEREVWDMYGIKFTGHPNLKRILLYEEFKGFPLRKDYPYNKQQPLLEDTWPVRDSQERMDERGIHRP